MNEYPTIHVRFAGSTKDVKVDLAASTVNNRIVVKVPGDAKSGTVKASKLDWGAGTSGNSVTIIRKSTL